MTPSRRRPVVSYWHDTYRVSERRACRVARMPLGGYDVRRLYQVRVLVDLPAHPA